MHRLTLIVNGKKYRASQVTLLRRVRELSKLGRVDLLIETRP